MRFNRYKYFCIFTTLISTSSFAINIDNFILCSKDVDKEDSCFKVSYANTGLVDSITFIKNGVLEGPVYIYNDKGLLYTKAWYIQGVATGLYQIFDDKGSIIKDTIKSKIECKTSDDRNKGCSEKIIVNDKVKMESSYKYGTKNGFEFEYYDSGAIEKMTFYKNGEPLSDPFLFKDDSFMKTTKICNTVEDKVSGCIQIIGDKDSYISGQIILKNGLGQGPTKFYYKNGNPHKIFTYNNNVIDGLYTEFYENGVVKQQYFMSQGSKVGIERLFKEDGSIEQEIHYKNGLKNGPFTIYNESGSILKISNYKDDSLEGVYQQYNEIGLLESESFYKAGEEVLYKTYDDLERILSITELKDGVKEGYSIDFYDDGKTIKTISLYKAGDLKEKTVFKEDSSIQDSFIYKDGIETRVSSNSLNRKNIDLLENDLFFH